MAYRFKINESFAKGVRRIGSGQLQRALQELREVDRTKAVHETRKAIKRLRALLRLARCAIGEPQFERENVRLRDIARQLSMSRDTTVLIGTVKKLAAACDDKQDSEVLKGALSALTALAADVHDKHGDTTSAAIEALESCEQAWKKIAVDAEAFEAIGQGLARTYRACRHRFTRAYADLATDDARDAAFHEWRKTVQQHWRHMRLMREGWPAYFDARADAARQLSDILGEAQDLTLLCGRAQTLAGEGLSSKQAARLVKVARRRQHDLRQAVRPLAERLLEEKPKELVRRIGVYWSTAEAIPQESKNGANGAAHQDGSSNGSAHAPSGRRPRPEKTKAKGARAGSARGS